MSATSTMADVTIPSDLAEARRLQEEIDGGLSGCAWPDDETFKIRLALEEALVNAIKHGNQMDQDKVVRVRYTITADRFDIRIEDEGPGFNPEDVPDPTLPENIEKGSGRGVFLIRELMSAAEYHGRGNVLVMWRVRGEGE
jgi:serine/threonine-protein kinase RsbW